MSSLAIVCLAALGFVPVFLYARMFYLRQLARAAARRTTGASRDR